MEDINIDKLAPPVVNDASAHVKDYKVHGVTVVMALIMIGISEMMMVLSPGFLPKWFLASNLGLLLLTIIFGLWAMIAKPKPFPASPSVQSAYLVLGVTQAVVFVALLGRIFFPFA